MNTNVTGPQIVFTGTADGKLNISHNMPNYRTALLMAASAMEMLRTMAIKEEMGEGKSMIEVPKMRVQ
jgi:hypothetical protein